MSVESSVRAGFMNIEQEITILSSNYRAVPDLSVLAACCSGVPDPSKENVLFSFISQ